MANIKSAKKRIKVTEVKTSRNRIIKSALKTTVKKFQVAVAAKNTEDAKLNYVAVVRSLDMAASKGVIHKNKAARFKSRFATKLHALEV